MLTLSFETRCDSLICSYILLFVCGYEHIQETQLTIILYRLIYLMTSLKPSGMYNEEQYSISLNAEINAECGLIDP
jgi:hypothetical protein